MFYLTVYFKGGDVFGKTAGHTRDELQPILDLCHQYEQPYTLNNIQSPPDLLTMVQNLLESEERPETPMSRGEQWADEHRGEQYKRPYGTVLYTVLSGDDLGFGGVRVRRSSDNRETTMGVAELQAMERVTT